MVNPPGVKGLGEIGVGGNRQRHFSRDRKARWRFTDYAR
jgi:hypothetical protein